MLQKIISKLFGKSHSVSVFQETQTLTPAAFEKDCLDFIAQADQCMQDKKYSKALSYCQRAIATDPSFIDAYLKSGEAHLFLQEVNKAVESYQMAIALAPEDYRPYFALGMLFQRQGNAQCALSFYEKTLAKNPSHAETLCNVAEIFISQYDQEASIENLLLQAISLKPTLAEAYVNLGVLYFRLGKFEDAIKQFHQALTLRFYSVELYANLALTLYCQNKVSDAAVYFKKALLLDPHSHHTKWCYSLSLLKSGDYKKGWEYYEQRLLLKIYTDTFIAMRYAPHRRWQKGDNIAGKTVMIHAEQGLGDTLQFVRFAERVVAKGATVMLDCQAELVTLFKNMSHIACVISNQEELPPFDLYASIMSLPYLLDITLQNLPAPAVLSPSVSLMTHWKNTLGDHVKYRIGVVWAGNARRDQKDSLGYYIDRRRSVLLSQFITLLSLDHVEWYSLQKGEPSAQIKTLEKHLQLRDYTNALHTLEDTAALIQSLDLVITVDTAVAHLSAMMGKPTWVLSRFDGCWRWLLDRNDSPWYPTVRLVRQKNPGEWDAVVQEIKTALMEKIAVGEHA